MKSGTVRRAAGKFAQALLEIGEHQGMLPQLLDAFETFLPLYRQNEELRIFFENPLVPLPSKHTVVDEGLAELLPAVAQNFLKVLLDYRKEREIDVIIEVFIHMAHQELLRVPVTATTATPISSDFLQVIQKKLEERLGGKIVLQNKVDQGLLGGILLQWNGSQLDGTIRGRLAKLRRYLLEGAA